MTMLKHELKQGSRALFVWTAAIGSLLIVCIVLFPEMKGEMDGIDDVFSSMGSFTEAFGMDKVNFGSFTGFYAVECGNILGLGGAFFASLCAISVIAKEERGHTAEFLLTHPVRRSKILTDKLTSVLLQIMFLNVVIYALAVVTIVFIGEPVPWKELSLLHLAYFLVQVELAGICFGISAFVRQGSVGIGIGVAVIMYFLHLLANIAEKAQFLDFITPFGYADGADIVTELMLDGRSIWGGMMIAVTGILAGYFRYCKKDIAA